MPSTQSSGSGYIADLAENVTMFLPRTNASTHVLGTSIPIQPPRNSVVHVVDPTEKTNLRSMDFGFLPHLFGALVSVCQIDPFITNTFLRFRLTMRTSSAIQMFKEVSAKRVTKWTGVTETAGRNAVANVLCEQTRCNVD